MLLHYLAVAWLFVGSEYFIDSEPGAVPWTLTEDFADYSNYRLYIFSVYWTSTIVTTVGYGDYSGSNSVEYMFTIMLEFLGMVVFATL